MINLEHLVERHIPIFVKQYENAKSYEDKKDVKDYYRSFLSTLLKDNEPCQKKYWIEFIKAARIVEPYK